MGSGMSFEMVALGKGFPAALMPAEKGSLPGVGPVVHGQTAGAGKGLSAVSMPADKGFLFCVASVVQSEMAGSGEGLSTARPGADKGSFPCMPHQVLSQQAGLYKGVFTALVRADKGFCGMHPAVLSQGIPSGKGFQAVTSGTDKGPRSCMNPAVVLPGSRR